MTTLNLTANNDIIIPTNDDTTYRGLDGDDRQGHQMSTVDIM